MDYHVLDPADLAPSEDFPCGRRSLTEAVDLATVAAAVYDLEPGEQLSRFYHYHELREELFYVISGSITVETPEGEYEVSTSSVFLAKPNSPHRPYNPDSADEPARVFGVGAPRSDVGRKYEPDTGDGLDEPE